MSCKTISPEFQQVKTTGESVCCKYTDVSAQLLLKPQTCHLGWMELNHQSHLFTRTHSRSTNQTAQDDTGSGFFPEEESSTKNPKVFSFDFYSTSNYHKLLFQVFTSLSNKAEKELAPLCHAVKIFTLILT